MAQTVFNRYEKKYLLSEERFLALRDRLFPHLTEDQYAHSTICNIYYDTPSDLLVNRSIAKPVYKEKLRLRSYGVPGMDDTVFLEIKKKYQKVVNKRRITLPLRAAYDFLENGIYPEKDTQITREIDFFLRRNRLRRRMYLAYDRLAMVAKNDPGFRITFDTRIRSRQTEMGLECGSEGELLLPEGCRLMETKVLGATPMWFSEILSSLAIYPTSFSKYGNFYKMEHDQWDPKPLLARLDAPRTDPRIPGSTRENLTNDLRRTVLC